MLKGDRTLTQGDDRYRPEPIEQHGARQREVCPSSRFLYRDNGRAKSGEIEQRTVG